MKPEVKISRQGQGGGRKRKYSDVKELDTKIVAYFEHALKTDIVPSISGLALFLGFASIQSLYEYGETPKFGMSIKKARLMIENAIEQRLLAGKPPIGLIFALKNRFQWQDVQKQDITSNGQTLGVVQLPARKAVDN